MIPPGDQPPELDQIDLARPWMGSEEQDAAARVIASGWVAQGPEVARFEQAVARVTDAAHAVAVSSATAGLRLALLAAGVHRGHEVVVPSLSFIATANSVVDAGAVPRFADVDPVTQNVTATTIAAALTPRTRAVTVVHQGGIPAELAPIHQLCDPLGIAVIEDAACALGSSLGHHPIGHDSPLAVFSFHARKIITTGEGGMVLTSDPARFDRLRSLRDHGVDADAYQRHTARNPAPAHYREPAFNYRMTDIQGAIGVVQVGRLGAILRRRRELAAHYQERLRALPGVVTTADPSYGRTNFQTFWVDLPDDFPVDRDTLMRRLGEQGIATRPGFMAAHLEPAYLDDPRFPAADRLPVTERLTHTTLCLPLHHGLGIAELDRVVDAIIQIASPGQPDRPDPG